MSIYIELVYLLGGCTCVCVYVCMFHGSCVQCDNITV